MGRERRGDQHEEAHLLALAFFVGGQLLLVAAVVPAVHRRGGDEALMRDVGRRFAIGSLVALGVLVGTGVALADRTGRWEDDTLQLKLLLVVVVAVLTGLHALTPRSRVVSVAVLLGSVAIVWLGVELSTPETPGRVSGEPARPLAVAPACI